MDYQHIKAAAQRLAGHARRTPLLSSPFLDEVAGRPVFVKAECLQHTGSFKYRGAKSALTAPHAQAARQNVLAFSSGNHAQGVALAAAQSGVTATILMPKDAPAIKIACTKALGAEVVLFDRYTDDRDALGAELAQAGNLRLIKPFDDPDVIAGQGSTGLEIADQAKQLGVQDAQVLVCCGGGGLTSGIALALAEDAPGMTVHTVEPNGFDDAARSLAAGKIVSNPAGGRSLCDAIVTPQPGNLTFPILSKLCGPGLAVSDEMCLRAMALAYQHLKIVIEPGGAVALAAALFLDAPEAALPAIAVATGGNVDPDVFARALKTL